MVTCKSAWPSGLRRCIQVAVYSCRRGLESHSWQFFIVLPSLTFDWQIKPARITFSRLKKHCNCHLLQANQGKKDLYISKHSFNIETWKRFCMMFLITKLDEQFTKFNSLHKIEQTTDGNFEKKWLVQWRPTSCFYYINKKQVSCQEWDSNPRLQE